MGLDLRWPMGWLFTLLGGLLIVFGLVSDRAIYMRTFGENVNLIWGCVLLTFGVVVLALARDARDRNDRTSEKGNER